MGTWEHMAIGIPMVLSNGIAGITFSGGKSGPDFPRCFMNKSCSGRWWILW